jgi:hypothetical protein
LEIRDDFRRNTFIYPFAVIVLIWDFSPSTICPLCPWTKVRSM